MKLLDSQIAEALAGLEAADTLDENLLGEDISTDRLPESIANLKDRREQLAVLMSLVRNTPNRWQRQPFYMCTRSTCEGDASRGLCMPGQKITKNFALGLERQAMKH
jgi:hypothetical protein